VRIGMSQRIFSPIGVVFGVQAAYTDLTAFDKSRHEQRSVVNQGSEEFAKHASASCLAADQVPAHR
jgi:hypothetical protein